MEKNYDEKSKLELEELGESEVDNVTGGVKGEAAMKYGGPRPKLDHPLLMYGGKKPHFRPKPFPKPVLDVYGGPPPKPGKEDEPEVSPEPLAPPTVDTETPKE